MSADHSKKTFGAIEPDVMLPTQFLRAVTSPETGLLVAVVQQAMWDLVNSADAEGPKAALLADEVRDWLTSPVQHSLYSFAMICDFLGIDRGSASKEILAMQPKRSRRRGGEAPIVERVRKELAKMPDGAEFQQVHISRRVRPNYVKGGNASVSSAIQWLVRTGEIESVRWRWYRKVRALAVACG